MTNQLASMPFANYLTLDRVHCSALKVIANKSPLHYRHYLQQGLAMTPDRLQRLRKGKAGHTAILEPDRFLIDYVLWDGPVRRGTKWDAFQEEHADKTILTASEYANAIALGKAVRANELAMRYLNSGEPEQSLLWTDSETGINCKGRTDWLNGAIVDIKTTGDADPFRFSRIAKNLGYHIQAAFYQDGLRIITGEEKPFVIVLVEADAPHDVVVYRVPEHVLEQGRNEYAAALERIAECTAGNHWPGRFISEQELQLPIWAYDNQDDIADLGLTSGGQAIGGDNGRQDSVEW